MGDRTAKLEDIDHDAYDLLVDLYLLGDLLDDIQLRNSTTRTLYNILTDEKSKSLPSTAINDKVWSSTPSGSLLRKLLVDSTITSLEKDEFAKSVATDPPEFVQEIAVALFRKLDGADLPKALGDGSQYLEQEEPKVNTT